MPPKRTKLTSWLLSVFILVGIYAVERKRYAHNILFQLLWPYEYTGRNGPSGLRCPLFPISWLHYLGSGFLCTWYQAHTMVYGRCYHRDALRSCPTFGSSQKKFTGSPINFYLLAAILVFTMTSHGRLKSLATGLHVQLLVRAKHKERAKLHISDPLCVVTGGFSPRMASNADRVSMSWRHHVHGIWLRNEQMCKQQWPRLLTCINFNPNMDKWFNPTLCKRCN